MTIREYAAWIDGYAKRLEDEWMQTREIMATIYNSQGVKTTGAELIKLESDKPKEIPRIPTLDERLKMAEKYGRLFT